MCRRIIQFIVGLPLFILLVAGIILSIVFITVSNREVYRSALDTAGVYQQLADSLQDAFTSYFEGSAADVGTSDLSGSFSAGIADLVTNHLDLELVKNTIDNNIENVFSYLNYASPELLVYIPINRIRAIVDDFTGEYVDNLILDSIADLPTCPSLETLDLSGELTCIPPGITPSQIKEQLPAGFIDSDSIFDQLTVYLPYLNSKTENIPISEVIPELSDTTQSEVNPLIQARDIFTWAKVGLIGGWVLTVLLLVMYLFLAGPGWVMRIKAGGGISVIVGAVVALAGIAVSGGFAALTRTLPAFPLELDPSIVEGLLAAAGLIVNVIVSRLLFVGITVMVGGLIIYVFGVLFSRRSAHVVS